MITDDNDFKGLEEYQIERWKNSRAAWLYPKLIGGIFHRTSIDGYRGIRREGFIYPNTGQFNCTYKQSTESYATLNKYISIFDFRSITRRQYIWVHDTWEQFFFDQKPITVVLRLNYNFLSKKLILNNNVPWAEDPKDFLIPYVEAWYPEQIPFSTTESLIISMDGDINEEPLFEEVSIGEISEFDDALKQIEEYWSKRY